MSGQQDAPARLVVGIGVATGRAFVGNVQAVDRSIWTAIGDTVNLAARLQALSRDLGAAIVIDSTTWSRLEADARARFVCHEGVHIRGRRQREDVYVVPLESSGRTEDASGTGPREVSRLRLVAGDPARRERPA